MKPLPTIEACHLLPLIRFLDTQGIESRKYLGDSNIPAELLDRPFYRISKHQYFEFHNRIASEHPLPNALDCIGGLLTDNQLHAVFPALRHSPTLLCLIRQYAGFLERSADFGTLVLRADPAEPAQAWLQYSASGDKLDRERGVVWQIHLASLVQIIRLCGGSDWIPPCLALQADLLGTIHLPAGLRNIPVGVAPSGVAIRFPLGWLWHCPAFPDATETEATVNSGGAHPETIPAQPESFGSSLYTILESQLKAVHYCPTYEEAAEICNLSTRSLNRMLNNEGTNYRELVGAARYNRARVLLESDPLMKVETVANLLGYQQLPAFVRAFKSMAGVSPSRYRANLAAA